MSHRHTHTPAKHACEDLNPTRPGQLCIDSDSEQMSVPFFTIERRNRGRKGRGEKGSAESNTGVHSGDERGGQKDRIGANTAVQSCYPVVTNARAVSLGLDARLANAHDRPM